MSSVELLRQEPATVPLRPPAVAMDLARMGSAFQTRLSFMRRLIRRMHREGWRIEATRFDLDQEGYGTVVYQAITPRRRYSLIGFSQYLDPEQRTDRVIAEAWDATFTLFDGVPSDGDIERLRDETPKQEAGRYSARELVLSRANKSLRLFELVTGSLAQGRQPDPKALAEVGYLMRTTAVYGNGKFGMADRARYADRPELAAPFEAEMLTVYLIRCFTHDLIEHLARVRNPAKAVPLAPALRRFLGIGNATGLGMAPFLVSHPQLIHRWYQARERALARVRALPQASEDEVAAFTTVFARARRHVGEWRVDDACQSERIARLRQDLETLSGWLAQEPSPWRRARPWDELYRRAEGQLSLEGQEILVSLLLEPHGELVDDLAEGLEIDEEEPLDAAMPLAELRRLLEEHYDWALALDFGSEAEDRYFWYYSQDKVEPRRGLRREEPGAEKEMPLAVARDVAALQRDLVAAPATETLASFLLRQAQHRHTVRRVQLCRRYPYAEIRHNLIAADCRPIDILRSKLAYFGASKFDPKSDLWTRITLYQGAPLPEELARSDADDWCFPVMPEGM